MGSRSGTLGKNALVLDLLDTPMPATYSHGMGRKISRIFGLCCAVWGAIHLGGCASTTIGRLPEGSSAGPLPTELQERFAVKSVSEQPADGGSAASVTPTAEVSVPESPKPSVKATKKSKKATPPKASPGSEPAVTPPAANPGAFIYPSRPIPREVFPIGEKLTYDLSYLGMGAGEFTATILPPKEINGRKVYHMRGEAKSSRLFELFYRVNDSVETFVDYEGFFSHRFHLVQDETKLSRDSLELYDHQKEQMYWWDRMNHHKRGYSEKKEYAALPKFPQDTVSGIYFLRLLDLKDGAVVEIPIVHGGKTWTATVTVIGREMINTPLGKVKAIKVKPVLQFQGVLKQEGGETYVWLSDDIYRRLLKLEAKVRIGTISVKLRSVEKGAG